MTEQEFERLQRRFGADVSAWPAPWRQEAFAYLGGADAADVDDALDRLVLDAARDETEEVALARTVLARINSERKPGLLSGALPRTWTMPAAASGFAVLLLVAAVGGYLAAGDAPEGLDDALLAFALGDGGISGDGGLLDDLPGEGQL
jgi:hypothetical protein